MPKIKLLFDMEQLSVDGLKGTGVVRVCEVLLRLLSKSDEIDVYPIVTTKRGDLNNYLINRGLKERFQDKIVNMPKLKATTKNQWWYQKLRSKVLTAVYKEKYADKLRQYDAYLSLFSPISPVVYESGLKTFMVIHDLIPIMYPDGCDPKFVKKFTDWIIRSHPDAYFCVSKYTAKDLCSFKPEAKDIQINTMYLGANERFKPIDDENKIRTVKDKYGIKTKKYFLAVSEITARKNLVHLLKSFVLFLRQTKAKDISLVLVGPVRKGYIDVANQVENLEQYQDKVIQTGFVDDADLAPLYSGAEAFIYPSLYEGFGLPILEAMQCGTPVILADNTSLPEVGGNAVLYISGTDENETMDKLLQIYQNDELAFDLRQKGLKRAKEFNWQKTADVVVNAVVKICKENKNDKSSTDYRNSRTRWFLFD